MLKKKKTTTSPSEKRAGQRTEKQAAPTAFKTFAISLLSPLGPIADRLNHIRLWLLLAALTAALTVGGYQLWSRYGLVIGFFIAIGICTLVFFYDDWRLMTIFPSVEIEGRDPWGVLAMVRDLARQNRMPRPVLREIKSPTPFLFSAGLVPSRLKIFISSSLLERLSSEELRAVIAHELLRSKTGLTQTTTAAAAIADLFLVATGLVDSVLTLRFLRRRPKRRVYYGPLTWMIFPLVAGFLRLFVRRKHFIQIDRLTAKDMGLEPALISAFVKLDSYGKNLPLDVNLAEAALFATDPLSFHSWSNWASVQPSLERRATALTGHFPL